MPQRRGVEPGVHGRPPDHLRADRDAEGRGLEIIGVMHSHTHTEAYPSPTDVAQAPDPAWHYVIVSLKRRRRRSCARTASSTARSPRRPSTSPAGRLSTRPVDSGFESPGTPPAPMAPHHGHDSILDLIGNTPMVDVSGLSPNPDVRILAKLEGQNPAGSVKDRIA